MWFAFKVNGMQERLVMDSEINHLHNLKLMPEAVFPLSFHPSLPHVQHAFIDALYLLTFAYKNHKASSCFIILSCSFP